MKRVPLGMLVSAAIVVFHLQLAAAPAPADDVPLPGGTVALARALGIEPVPDRGRFMSEITRLAYDAETRNPAAAAFLAALRDPAARDAGASRTNDRAETVPVPLSADVWGSAIFRRRMAPADLVTSIVADRAAALLCHGLAALDDETLAFLADHRGVLTRLYERSPGTFAAFSDSLHIAANRVIPPGGADAEPLWETAVGEKVTRPERFVTALFEASDGRLAYLYDVVGRLDPPRRAFATGAWMPNPAMRAERFKELVAAAEGAFGDWHVRVTPFGRVSWDLGTALSRVEVTDTGAPAPPSSRALWTQAFASTDIRELPPPSFDDAPFDAAWLVSTVGVTDVRVRLDRLDALALGQRAFRSATSAQWNDVFVALRAVPHYRMLMLTLDRIGIRTPAVYAAAARQAQRLRAYEGARGYVVQAQFQGALALVVRMVTTRSINRARAESLVKALVDVPLREDGRYGGGVARWLRDNVVPRASGDAEAALIDAISGPPSRDPSTPVRIVFEGQPYRLDLGFAERRRLERVREKQSGLRLDLPLELAAVADTVRAGSADISAAAARLIALAMDAPEHARESGEWLPPGVTPDGNARDTLRRAAEELTRAARARDPKRGVRAADPLADLADDWLAQVLLSFTYALHVGDPDGTVLLAGDVSARHDFGFGSRDAALRARAAWALPKEIVSPSAPWHVAGSLLGLDVALAPLALRRLNFDHLTGAPKLTSNARDAFAAGVSLMNPYDLRDEDRDAIADAAAAGTRLVAAAVDDPAAFDRLADDLRLDGGRRRALQWTRAHEPDRFASMFTLGEIVAAGAGRRSFDAWGSSALFTASCLCTRAMPPGSWWIVVGRPQLGLAAASVVDINLHVAIRLKELQLPAPLARIVLSAAVQDLIDELRPTDDADWLTVGRSSTAATREQIEDYLAAATADGPLVPIATGSTP